LLISITHFNFSIVTIYNQCILVIYKTNTAFQYCNAVLRSNYQNYYISIFLNLKNVILVIKK